MANSEITNATRHLTASMVVVDLADGTVLLVHHNATGMWLGQLELFGLTGGAR